MILLAVWLLIDTIVPSQYGRSFQPWKAYDSPGSNIQEMSKKMQRSTLDAAPSIDDTISEALGVSKEEIILIVCI